ncbi:GntR family transcriptional regulator [Labrys sp. LIt4]|uniref:GntR family transcriptional regulator n=1 Tax=Labrys sp. LIt4 TaxID=2821355 RepID=UPI001ADFDA1C|nr:GntR family transcriptional regulator [Labrys sp. LIt4]
MGIPATRRRLNEIVAETLASHIRSGALPAGFVIREKAVTDLFGVGRMPAVVALARLEAERLVHRRPALRGVVVGLSRTVPARPGDLAGHVALPEGLGRELRQRNWRSLIYPALERQVASCLLFGRFQIRTPALAEHFGVSRTIAHELLLRLERVGLVRQEVNARWYAGPLTPARIDELYEMRILLEPAALRQAVGRLEPSIIEERLERVSQAHTAEARADASLLHRLETDLHQDVVLRCANEELRATLYRCQLPLISVHLSFGSYGERTDIPHMIGMHKAVLEHLAGGRVEAAASALESHLRHSREDNPARLADLPALAPSQLDPYLDPI